MSPRKERDMRNRSIMTEEQKEEQKEEKAKIGTVGGEALMEGIMMRGPKGAAM